MKLFRKFRALFRKRKLEAEMAEEMRLHLELQAEKNVASGMGPDEARYAAQRMFGHIEGVKELARDQRQWRWLEDAVQDVRIGARMLRRQPGFAVVCIGIMALGVGANTAIFSVLNAVVLRPLAVPAPERLMRIWETNPARGVQSFSVAFPNYDDWARRSRSWSQMAAVEERGVNLVTGKEAIRVWAQLVTPELLPMLGWSVALGRGFVAEDNLVGRGDVAILSDGFWRARFGAQPGVVGRSLVVDGRSYTVVGVLAPGLGPMREAELFLPLRPFVSQDRTEHQLDVYARLRPSVSREQAASEMNAVAREIEREHPEENAGWGARLEPLSETMVGTSVRRSMFLVFGVAGLLLAIACANLSGLFLMHSSRRSKELAVRAALGGGRGRLIRQLLTESLLLAAIGGGVGVLLAAWSIGLMRGLAVIGVPRAEEIALDQRVLWFSAIATLLTGTVAGLLPARAASRIDLQHSLKAGNVPAGKVARRLRNTLVIGQLALSIVLLFGAGLLSHALFQLQRIDLGYRPDSVLTARIAPAANGPALVQRLIERVQALPGVRSVAAISLPPMMPFNTSLNVFPVGPAKIPLNESIQAEWRIATAGYFRTMQIPFLQGRDFTPADNESQDRVVIVNETLARLLWGREDPIGRQINPGGGTTYSTVIGVVGDVRSRHPGEAPGPGYYMSAYRGLWGATSLVVRTTQDAEVLVPLLRAEWKLLDPGTPLFRVQLMNELVEHQLAPRRIVTALLVAFAGVALLLAATGLYGVMAHATALRTREVGIRMALGARRVDVLWPMMKDGAGLVVTGVGAGLLLALGAAQLLRGMLAGISRADPVALVTAALLLAGTALVACWLPARRAAKVDPMVALRAE
jgi:predicted permease